jgi:hypothetical protein
MSSSRVGGGLSFECSPRDHRQAAEIKMPKIRVHARNHERAKGHFSGLILQFEMRERIKGGYNLCVIPACAELPNRSRYWPRYKIRYWRLSYLRFLLFLLTSLPPPPIERSNYTCKLFKRRRASAEPSNRTASNCHVPRHCANIWVRS